MRSLIFPAAIVAALSLTSAAFAAPASPSPAASTQASSAQAVTPAKGNQASITKAKRSACASNWRDQKHHSGTRRAFMDACVTKG